MPFLFRTLLYWVRTRDNGVFQPVIYDSEWRKKSHSALKRGASRLARFCWKKEDTRGKWLSTHRSVNKKEIATEKVVPDWHLHRDDSIFGLTLYGRCYALWWMCERVRSESCMIKTVGLCLRKILQTAPWRLKAFSRNQRHFSSVTSRKISPSL